MSYPSENQSAAIDFLINAVKEEEHVVVLTGQGGSGKTTIAKELLKFDDITVIFSATTNKAASRLNESVNSNRAKQDQITCGTLHSIISKPIFTPEYRQIEKYYEGELDVESLSNRTKEFLLRYISKELDYYGSVHELLKSNNIDSFDDKVFIRYDISEPKKGTLVIDEASMLPSESIYKDNSLKVIGLDSVKSVFKSIILLGDINQLPPIQGKSSFEGLPTFELTKNYRANKKITGIINAALEGKSLELYHPKDYEKVKIVNAISQDWYERTNMRTDVAHIVYRNKTRKTLTRKIRGNNSKHKNLEPVFYNGFSNDYISKGEIGLALGDWALFGDIKDENKNENYLKEHSKEFYQIKLKGKKFDEYSESYSVLRYGYCITAHMSQGSEWDHIIVHLYDIPYFVKGEELRKWIYTAVSRARKSVTIVR